MTADHATAPRTAPIDPVVLACARRAVADALAPDEWGVPGPRWDQEAASAAAYASDLLAEHDRLAAEVERLDRQLNRVLLFSIQNFGRLNRAAGRIAELERERSQAWQSEKPGESGELFVIVVLISEDGRLMRREVWAYATDTPGLAVYDGLDDDHWYVAHVATGRRMPWRWEDWTEAMDFAERIGVVCDWTTSEPTYTPCPSCRRRVLGGETFPDPNCACGGLGFERDQAAAS